MCKDEDVINMNSQQKHIIKHLLSRGGDICVYKKIAKCIICQSCCHPAHWEQCKPFTLRTEWDWTHSGGHTTIRFKFIVAVFYTIQEGRLDVSPEYFTHES